MEYMFESCSTIGKFDLSNFDTSNVINMRYMFSNCLNLTSLELSSDFNTKLVTDMSGMFASCPLLTTIDLTHLDTKCN